MQLTERVEQSSKLPASACMTTLADFGDSWRHQKWSAKISNGIWPVKCVDVVACTHLVGQGIEACATQLSPTLVQLSA